MRAICTTTINPPTEALELFLGIAKKNDWKLYIAGDLKTPHGDYYKMQEENPEHVVYLPPAAQETMNQELSDAIGWKCIQRRNFAILAAYKDGADVLALVDDDNIPYDFWGEDLAIGKDVEVPQYCTDQVVCDPLARYSSKIWHRGFPVQLLKNKGDLAVKQGYVMNVLVQADLWNGDPDVDAICRIAESPEVHFDVAFPHTSNKPMPFNSQNTFISREIVPFYFLFPHIGRMDDIWAAYAIQKTFPESVMFGVPSVYQERNPHDLVKDLEAEMIGYRHTLDFVTDLFNPNNPLEVVLKHYLPEESFKAYEIWRSLF